MASPYENKHSARDFITWFMVMCVCGRERERERERFNHLVYNMLYHHYQDQTIWTDTKLNIISCYRIYNKDFHPLASN